MSNYEFGDFGNLGATSEGAVSDARKKFSELTDVQKKVDEGLKNMPEGPEKQRLLKIRNESRGVFSKYILPAYNKLKNMLGSGFAGEEMGILPLVPIAAAAAATAMLGYVGNSIIMERRILNDPSFTAAQKAQMLSGGGLKSLVGVTGNLKTIAIVGVLAFLAFQFMKTRKHG